MQRMAPKYARLLAPILAGLLVCLVSIGLSIGIAQAQDGGTPGPTPEAAATPTAPLKACADCHPDVADHWAASPHANAFDNPAFAERWKASGQPGECLVCHTTGYQADSGQYLAAGVTCQSCHGEALEGHPPAVIPVRADTEYCGTCHTTTLGEWRLTGHAAAGVGCADCHNPHTQGALFEDPDEMCVNCHKDDITQHKDDLHIQKGITCVECHMLRLPPATPPADGLVPTGHSFTITSATCVACHTDTLRIGDPLPGYETGAKAVSAGLPTTTTLPSLVNQYTGGSVAEQSLPAAQQIQALEATLASTRLSTLFQGGIIGLVLGGTTAFFMARNQRRESEVAAEIAGQAEAPEEPGDEQA